MVNAEYTVTERKRGERERQSARKREKERKRVHTHRKKREGRDWCTKGERWGSGRGRSRGGGTPENGLAQLRRLAGGESAG